MQNRVIAAAGLFWLGVLSVLGSALAGAASVQANEGLADLGYALLAVTALGLAGGLHGAFLLVTPPRPPRWKLVVAIALCAATLLGVALVLSRGASVPGGRVLAFAVLVTLPALAGLVRVPRLRRSA